MRRVDAGIVGAFVNFFSDLFDYTSLGWVLAVAVAVACCHLHDGVSGRA